MPAIPESTKTSLAQRLRAHAKDTWPQLTTVHVRYRASSSPTSSGELADGDTAAADAAALRRIGPPVGTWPSTWPATDGYENQIWFTGSPRRSPRPRLRPLRDQRRHLNPSQHANGRHVNPRETSGGDHLAVAEGK